MRRFAVSRTCGDYTLRLTARVQIGPPPSGRGGRLRRHARRREPILHPSPSRLPHDRATGGLRHQVAHGPGEVPIVVGSGEEPRHALLHHVHVSRHSRGGHGQLAGHGLEDGQRQPFLSRRGDVEVEAGRTREASAMSPAILTRASMPRAAASPRRRGASGPSPTMTRRAAGSWAAARAKARSKLSRPLTGSKRATVPSTSASGSSRSSSRAATLASWPPRPRNGRRCR